MNQGPECLKCGLAQDWDHERYGCAKPTMTRLELAERVCLETKRIIDQGQGDERLWDALDEWLLWFPGNVTSDKEGAEATGDYGQWD